MANSNTPLERRSVFSNQIFNSDNDISLRIMAIIALSGAIGNTIGFIANFLLYGMTLPTAFCAICDVFAILFLLLGIKSKNYFMLGSLLLLVLVFFEFPMLVIYYGPVMYPYLLIGVVTTVMLTQGEKRIVSAILVGVFDLAIIIISTVFSSLYVNYKPLDLVGSGVVTFSVAVFAISVCITMWQTVTVAVTREKDPVTGCLTQAGFNNKVKTILSTNPNGKYAILFFDIESFKVVNSVYGIEGGNVLLSQIASRIASSDLSPIAIGRSSSDHFLCLCEESKISESVIEGLCRYKFTENGKTISISVICGVYPISDLDLSVQSMCDRAQIVTKLFPEGQKQHFGYFDSKVEYAFLEETDILGETQQAVENNVFEPYYQPIVDCETGKIVAAEALARWNHPEKGLLSPAVFIPILEKKEMISDLDACIANKVNKFIENRIKKGLLAIPVSVNLSRVDFFDRKMIENLQIMVQESSVKGNCLQSFEVTESAYEALPQNIMDILSGFRNLGAKILIDDFGSGYSSLGMLADYEFDIIKLDMKFTRKIESNKKVQGVIRSIIKLAHSLNAKVVVEGVETDAQLNFLRESGCDLIQGYYFYKPMCEAEFAKLLDSQN